MTKNPTEQSAPFHIEEATVDQLHQAIKSGETTCVNIVRQYLDRIRAYNGVSSMLVTEDGNDVSPAIGAVRCEQQLSFPTQTVKASTILPDLDKYQGSPLEFGRMEATASDPGVSQQFGMLVGIRDAGQVNALATINIRGERSVTCRGDFDRHISDGPLPSGAPPVCEHFRRLPDALERAAELDERYGREPDLENMPMYGVTFSFKDPFDTKDMRSTGGVTLNTMLTSPLGITVWWSSSGIKEQSYWPKQSTPNTTGEQGIRVAAIPQMRCYRQYWDINEAHGVAILPTLMTLLVQPR